MFCSNCGKSLEDTDLFCAACGARIAADVQAPAQEEETSAVLPEEPVVTDAPVAQQTPAEPEETAEAVNEDAAEEEKVIEEAVYSNPTAPAQKHKKSRKVAAILIPILAVLLLAAAAFGFYMWAEHTYEQATASLQQKNYEQALELYGKFPFYKDCQEQIDELNRLQTAYDEANELVGMNQYVKAKDVYRALGDYRDSSALLMTRVPYLQAQYLMASAAANDSAALPQHPGYQEGTAYDADVTVFLYEGAAEVFLSLGEYEDSAALSSQCYREIAFTYMEQGLFEKALGCQEYLNEADHETVLAEYLTYCADEAAFADLTKAVQTRLEKEAAYAEDPEMTQKDLVDEELAILSGYAEDLMYYDSELKDLMASYLTGLETEASALGESGYSSDLSVWYAGNAIRFAVIETMIDKYDFLSDDAAAQTSFDGLAAQYQAFSALEKALDQQIVNGEAQYSDEDGDYYVFENTTGYAFTLVLSHTFTDAAEETVLFHETESILIGLDETVNIPFMAPSDDEEWENLTINWEYEIEMN